MAVTILRIDSKLRMQRKRGRKGLTDRFIDILKLSFLLLIVSIAIYFIGFIIVFKFLVILISVIFFVGKINKHFHKSIEINTMRVAMMLFMMILSSIALVLSAYLVIFIVNFLGINIVVVKWFSIFEKDQSVVSANSIFFFIIIIFLPAFHIYNFIKMISTSLFERWFSKNKVFRDVTRCYDEKIFLAYFTMITVFMGFLPMFAGEILAVIEEKESIGKLSLIFLMMSLLPNSQLLFAQAKR